MKYSELSFLTACKEMAAANHIIVARLFNESTLLLWPKRIKYDNVLLFYYRWSVVYEGSSGSPVCVSYQKLIHFTCTVHEIHRVCKPIGSLYSNVDRLVYQMERKCLINPLQELIFLKTKILTFQHHLLSLAVSDCIAEFRWGLSTVQYYICLLYTSRCV